MIATFIIARIKIFASIMRNGAKEIRRCDVKSGNVLDIEHLFRVDGLRAFDRIFNVPIVMQPEREYEVIIRFLNPRFIMPHLSVGKQFALEIGSDVGAGTVLEIHDYDDLMTTWAPVDCPWTGNGVTRPDYYLTTPLFGKGKMPIACFVRRKEEMRGAVVHEVAIDPTLDRETAKRHGLEDGQLFVKLPKSDTIGGKAVVLSSIPDGRWFSRSKNLAPCKIYQTLPLAKVNVALQR